MSDKSLNTKQVRVKGERAFVVILLAFKAKERFYVFLKNGFSEL